MICPVKWLRSIGSCDHVTFAQIILLFYTFYITKITLQLVVLYRFTCVNNLQPVITNRRVQIASLVFVRKLYSIGFFGCIHFIIAMTQKVQIKDTSNCLVQSYFIRYYGIVPCTWYTILQILPGTVAWLLVDLTYRLTELYTKRTEFYSQQSIKKFNF